MKKKLLFVCCFVAGLLFATAQERKDLPDGACGTDALHLKLLKESPDYREKFNKNNAFWQEWAPKQSKTPAPQSVLIKIKVLLKSCANVSRLCAIFLSLSKF